MISESEVAHIIQKPWNFDSGYLDECEQCDRIKITGEASTPAAKLVVASNTIMNTFSGPINNVLQAISRESVA